MGVDNSKVRKSSLIATVLFAVAFAIYGFLFISDFETSTTSKNSLRGILAGLFGILSIVNYMKFRQTKA